MSINLDISFNADGDGVLLAIGVEGLLLILILVGAQEGNDVSLIANDAGR